MVRQLFQGSCEHTFSLKGPILFDIAVNKCIRTVIYIPWLQQCKKSLFYFSYLLHLSETVC